jgi:general secretion pathway protein G
MSRRTAVVALGFTVLALVATNLLLPSYVTSPQQVRERALRQDLRTMNAVITQYTLDNQLPPHSLDDLVVAGYLKEVPHDPMTERKDTWVVKCSSNLLRRGIVGIESGYENTANKGSFRCD